MKTDFNPQRRVDYLTNPERKSYLITDNPWDSPVGFGAKSERVMSLSETRSVARGKTSKEVIRSTIGNVSDFVSIDQAREAVRNSVMHKSEFGEGKRF